MDILLAVAAMLAAIHGFLYGKWLMKQNVRDGAFFVYLLVALCVVLPIYKILNAP